MILKTVAPFSIGVMDFTYKAIGQLCKTPAGFNIEYGIIIFIDHQHILSFISRMNIAIINRRHSAHHLFLNLCCQEISDADKRFFIGLVFFAPAMSDIDLHLLLVDNEVELSAELISDANMGLAIQLFADSLRKHLVDQDPKEVGVAHLVITIDGSEVCKELMRLEDVSTNDEITNIVFRVVLDRALGNSEHTVYSRFLHIINTTCLHFLSILS